MKGSGSMGFFLGDKNVLKLIVCWSSCCGTVEMNPISIREEWVQSLASLSGRGIQHCHKLWYMLQVRLGSHIAVAVAVAVA